LWEDFFPPLSQATNNLAIKHLTGALCVCLLFHRLTYKKSIARSVYDFNIKGQGRGMFWGGLIVSVDGSTDKVSPHSNSSVSLLTQANLTPG
jgi:hypothetical protein